MTFRGIVDNVPITWETSFFLALLLRSQTQRARLVLLLDTQTIAKANNTGAKLSSFEADLLKYLAMTPAIYVLFLLSGAAFPKCDQITSVERQTKRQDPFRAQTVGGAALSSSDAS